MAVSERGAIFDNSVQFLMFTVDAFDVAQQAGHKIDVPLFRKKLGEQIRPMIAERDRVLAPFGITPDDHESEDRERPRPRP
ncbi:MAG: hypothetical protein QOD65_1056 [Gaiellales bacterium]|jgi:hypothetical protein|nr:hypothetical protein [Gaiellales bacterium]